MASSYTIGDSFPCDSCGKDLGEDSVGFRQFVYCKECAEVASKIIFIPGDMLDLSKIELAIRILDLESQFKNAQQNEAKEGERLENILGAMGYFHKCPSGTGYVSGMCLGDLALFAVNELKKYRDYVQEHIENGGLL